MSNLKTSNIDLHCHPCQKTFLLDDVITDEYIEFITKVFLFGDENSLLGDILDTQSSIAQLKTGKLKLVFWNIVPIERQFLRAKKLAQALSKISVTVGGFTPERLDIDFVNQIARGDLSYYSLLKKEWDIMEQLVAEQKNVQFIQPGDNAPNNKINIIPCAEGFHAFSSSTGDDMHKPKSVKTNFKRFTDRIANNGLKLGYVTLTHLTQTGIFNHCHGSKLVGIESLVKNRWLPAHLHERGYTDLGKELIDECANKGIAIDLKHTSYVARQSIYQYLENANNPPRLMATHCGVTGRSMKETLRRGLNRRQDTPDKIHGIDDGSGQKWVKLLYWKSHAKAGLRFRGKKTPFGPNTINLFDEDIVRIMELGGLIGISLDQRVLGFKGTISEFLTYEDYTRLCYEHPEINALKYFDVMDKLPPIKAGDYSDINKYRKDLFSIIRGEITMHPGGTSEHKAITLEAKNWKPKRQKRRKTEKKLAHFANTILHVLDVAHKNGIKKPWKQIAVGSDFDGLVDAIDSCIGSQEFPTLKSDLIDGINRTPKVKRFLTGMGTNTEEVITHIFELNAMNFYK